MALKPAGPPPANNDAYILAIRPVRKVRANFALRYNEPNIDVDKWQVMLAKPPELVGQRKTALTTTPPGKEVSELSPEHRPVVRISIPGMGPARHSMTVRAEYQAVLYARELLLREPGDELGGPPDLEPAVRGYYLRDTKTLDFRSPVFTRWLLRAGLRRGRAEAEIAFARRALTKIVDSEMEYTLGNSKVSESVQKRKGDCVAFSQVYVSTLRANGIPARTLVGRWAESAKPNEKLEGEPWYQTHCMTEFFAPHVGWVPVDPACGVFGKADGNFLAFHVDPDLVVPTGMAGNDPMNYSALQPAGYLVSTSAKFEEAQTADEKWDVKADPVKLPAADPSVNNGGDDPELSPDGDGGGFTWWRHRRLRSAVIIRNPRKPKAR